MTYLSDILDMTILANLIKEGYISQKFHRQYPLVVLNYTPQAQYDPKLVWGNEMNLCRGLVYCSDTMEVVARPFAKFWNLNDDRHPETVEANLPNETPLFLEKLDGSMGTLFAWDGLNHVATRGSFHSEQADWATNWLRSNYPRLTLPKEYTLVSEVIYSENKIVIDYDFEGLVVLGAVNIATGAERSRSELKDYCRAMGLSVVKEYRKTLSESLAENEKNREGYVLTYPSTGLKVKVKFDEYVRLHKILTGLNVRSVWELFRDGSFETIQDWLHDGRMPESFKIWVKNIWDMLTNQFDTIHWEVQHIYGGRPKLDPFMPYKESRKKMAEYFTSDDNKVYAGLLFGLLDGKNIDPMIWKMIEPSGNTVYRADGE
jgi:RNA ligase